MAICREKSGGHFTNRVTGLSTYLAVCRCSDQRNPAIPTQCAVTHQKASPTAM